MILETILAVFTASFIIVFYYIFSVLVDIRIESKFIGQQISRIGDNLLLIRLNSERIEKSNISVSSSTEVEYTDHTNTLG